VKTGPKNALNFFKQTGCHSSRGTALKNKNMAPTKAQKEVAAQAQAYRHPRKPHPLSEITIKTSTKDPHPISPIFVGNLDEDCSECGYVGGVNFLWCDPESDYARSEHEWEDSDLDTKSLVELEGDELENNLQSLRGGSEFH
jgi:hypothetical protein